MRTESRDINAMDEYCIIVEFDHHESFNLLTFNDIVLKVISLFSEWSSVKGRNLCWCAVRWISSTEVFLNIYCNFVMLSFTHLFVADEFLHNSFYERGAVVHTNCQLRIASCYELYYWKGFLIVSSRIWQNFSCKDCALLKCLLK